jgi:hypothetical protein
MDTQAVLVVVVAFAVMLGLPLATGYVAERKGRSFLGWAAIGFFLGVVGLAVALVVPRRAR